ncbi:MAG: PQQ-dependent sugar dehydrogenase [Bacteroidota bacterium]
MPTKLTRTIFFIITLPSVFLLYFLKNPADNYTKFSILSNQGYPETKIDTEANRFTKTVLIEKMDEPLQLSVLDANRVLYIERKGKIWLYDNAVKKKKLVATIPVSTKYTDKAGKKSEAEDGLLGIAADPDFITNKWIYLYYSPAGTESKNVLARFEFSNNKLSIASKKIVLEVPTQREQCCHTGGGITFDGNNNLYLSTGDNTSPRATSYSPIDERKGRSPWDAQKSSANTNDLRGKIIRIHPLADGKYTIPEGNLFPKGTNSTRPEIYVMGTRNPYRISVDKRTGYLYWGDVGPDSGTDSTGFGPRSYDEINQAKAPGYYGWPYFVGDNQAYWKYDFTSNTPGEKFDPGKPVNTSPNNTGLNELPPAQKPMIWYSYELSREFPLVGTGGRSAMAGPVFYTDDFKNAKRKFPDYYNCKLFIYEWMRDWIMAVTLNENGTYKSMEKFLPGMPFSHPIDMQFGPEGDLYVIEYGTGWFQGNDDARLVRIEYNGGNRKPIVQADADKKAGATPMAVHFSSAGTRDDDNDSVQYEWKITNAAGVVLKTMTEPNPGYEFTKPGVYKASLTVTDAHGAKSSSAIRLEAGNEPPVLDIEITKGNTSYFFPKNAISYNIKVSDKEDGELGKGIIPAKVNVDISYVNDGSLLKSASAKNAAPSTFAEGQRLIALNDCKSCHAPNKKIIGPSYASVSQKYRNNTLALSKLTEKVIKGGNGVWGNIAMSAHPQIPKRDVAEMIKYILSLGTPQIKTASLPLKGSYSPKIPDSSGEKSVVVINARYTDKGAKGMSPATTEKRWILKNPKLFPATVWKMNGIQKFKLPDPPMEMFIVMNQGTWVAYDQVDLTGITQISFSGAAPKEQLNAAGGTVEVRLDKPDGEIIGETQKLNVFNGAMNEIKPLTITAKIKEITGTHMLYFVFRNPEAKGPLFIIFSATLENK